MISSTSNWVGGGIEQRGGGGSKEGGLPGGKVRVGGTLVPESAARGLG